MTAALASARPSAIVPHCLAGASRCEEITTRRFIEERSAQSAILDEAGKRLHKYGKAPCSSFASLVKSDIVPLKSTHRILFNPPVARSQGVKAPTNDSSGTRHYSPQSRRSAGWGEADLTPAC